jgi:hypothetical protein
VQFKLDENADPRWAEPLTSAGFEVSTVALDQFIFLSVDHVRRTATEFIR